MLKKILILCLLMLMTISCSTREILSDYSGSTQQRLITHSIRKLIDTLPENDFSGLREKKVYIESYFVHKSETLNYAKTRFKFELLDKYNCKIVEKKSESQIRVYVFFTSLGTDKDTFGISVPDFIVPGVGVIPGVKIIALDKYHGITELYYYITDENDMVISKSNQLKKTIRNDSLAFPFITIPISTVD